MKREFLSILGICICVFLLIVAQQAGATQFIDENWDSGTPPSNWPCKNSSDSTFNGWYTTGAQYFTADGSAGMFTSPVHSGTKSFRQIRPSGSTTSCDIAHDISGSPTTIYMRFYLYMTSNWSGSWTDNASWMHWIFTNTGLSNTGFRLNMVTDHEWGTCPHGKVCILPEGNGGVQWWNTSWPAGIDLKSIIEKWTCFEYKMQISGSNVILTEWINGTQTRGPVTGPGQNTSNFNRIILSGWENSGVAHDADWYIDDIKVSDSGPIGCGGSATPMAPALQ